MTHTMKQFEVLNWASLFLENHNCEKKVAEILLMHHLNVSQSMFYMNMREPVSEGVIQAFQADIKQHVETGIPVQHLIGSESFYGRKFAVTKHTLIPRPETEELVQHVITTAKQMNLNQSLTIVDIGTGSGVIATTLALEIPSAIVYGTDISRHALEIAEKNRKQLEADVTFLQGDFLQPLMDRSIQADIIVSNPPYIAMSDKSKLSRTVKDFDPELALFAENDGLAAYEQIIELSTEVLKPGGIIAFEIGYRQAEAVRFLLKNTYPQSNVHVIQDINGKDRIVSAKIS